MSAHVFTRIVLGLSSLTFAGLGVSFLLDPVGMAAVVELEPTSALAVSDVRAVYGGLEIGLAWALGATLRSASTLRGGVILHNIVWGGLAGGRSLAFALGEGPDSFAWMLLGSEMVGLGLGVAAWWAMRRSRETD